MYHRIGKHGEKYWGKAGAGILFTDGKKVLLLKRAESDHKDTWGMPGGKCELGESAIAASVREVKEECGIDHVPGTRFDSFANKDGRHTWTTFLFRVGEPFKHVRLSNEHSAWKWFDLSDLSEANLHPKFKQQLPQYLNSIRSQFPRNFKEWIRLKTLSDELFRTC